MKQAVTLSARRSAKCIRKTARIFRQCQGKSIIYSGCVRAILSIRRSSTACMRTGQPLSAFKKTRGVLRLMAAVVHNLWMNQDGSLLIMPGSLSLDVSTIRDELTRHVGDNWNAIVDHEVDGKNSIPYQKDQEIPRFGHIMAARRRADHYAGQRTEHPAGYHPRSGGFRIRLGCYCSPGKTLQRSTMR